MLPWGCNPGLIYRVGDGEGNIKGPFIGGLMGWEIPRSILKGVVRFQGPCDGGWWRVEGGWFDSRPYV